MMSTGRRRNNSGDDNNNNNCIVILLLFTWVVLSHSCFSYASAAGTENSSTSMRYLLYDVNPGEGFNLRRDVYMRISNMVRLLNEDGHHWTLVLHPWGPLYHWKSFQGQNKIPWSQFFDLPSLQNLTNVIEMEEWLSILGKPAVIDELYYLQSYSEGWIDGKWTERWEKRPCNSASLYRKSADDGKFYGRFWDYDDISAKKFACLSVQAQYKSFKDFLVQSTSGKSVMIHRAETLIHGEYSEWSKDWWMARRSMRFSNSLRQIADTLRVEMLNSQDSSDKTVLLDDWKEMKAEFGSAAGGPYVATHLRRRDFLYGHSKEIPSLEYAAEQLDEILKRENLTTVYIATDAPDEEFNQIESSLWKYKVVRFKPDMETLRKIGDGGVAIIDQWICAHARYFTGTRTSTFSFRIHEERSLLGFPPDSTYNRLCGDEETMDTCKREQPGRWFPKYD